MEATVSVESIRGTGGWSDGLSVLLLMAKARRVRGVGRSMSWRSNLQSKHHAAAAARAESLFRVFQTHPRRLISKRTELKQYPSMKLLSALSILLAVPFASSTASGTGTTSRSLAGGRAGRLDSDDSSTAIDDDDDHTPLYGGGTSQTLISASSSSSSSSSEDYRSIRPHGFWNEEDSQDDDDDAIASGQSELATIATVVTTPTTLLRGADVGGEVSDRRVLKAGIVGEGGKVCRMCEW